MSDLSKLLGTAGAPHQIAHEGKVYSFRLIDKKAMDAVAKRLYQNARDAVYEDRARMTSDEYTARLDRVARRYEEGEFAFTGEHAQRLLATPTGAFLLLGVLTGETEEAITALIAARAEEVKSLLKVVMSESFPRAPEVKPDA